MFVLLMSTSSVQIMSMSIDISGKALSEITDKAIRGNFLGCWTDIDIIDHTVIVSADKPDRVIF